MAAPYRITTPNHKTLRQTDPVEWQLDPLKWRDNFLTPFDNAVEDFFQSFFKDAANLDKIKADAVGFPKMDIFTEEGELFIKAVVAGFPLENITIEMRPQEVGTDTSKLQYTLRISGKSESSSSDRDYYLKELSKRNFVRDIRLPDWVQSDPEVVHKDGVLTLSWMLPESLHPTIKEYPQPRIVKIKKE